MENIPRGTQNETINTADAERFDRAAEEVMRKDYFRRISKAAMVAEKRAAVEEDDDDLANMAGVGEFARENVAALEDNEVEENNRELGAAERAMHDLIRKSFSAAGRRNTELKRAEETFEFVLDQKRADFREENPAGAKMQKTPSDEKILREQAQLRAIRAEREKLKTLSPEAFTLINGLELMQNKKQAMGEELIETPYVLERERELMENMKIGAPTFVQGHLGSGKTELAKAAARKVTTEKVAIKTAKGLLERENPELASKTGTNKYYVALEKIYRNEYKKLERAYAQGDPEVYERLRPLVVQGTRETTTQDLFMDKTLRLKADEKNTAGQKSELDFELAVWKAEHARELAVKSAEERARDEEEFRRLFIASKQVHGTEVVAVENQLVKAMREGRPVIIDEANMIPTEVLMSLNGVLTMRPGQICPIPGTNEAVKIADGFSITITGNESSNLVEYLGTNELNLANKSRFTKFEEYQYLPQSVDGTFENRHPEKDELYRVVVSALADRHGNLQLPEMQESLAKIYRLCQLARETQDIFSGKATVSSVNADASGDVLEQRLKKSFMSMRDIIGVMQKWDKGNEMDLDTALFKGFIVGADDAEDRNLIIRLARRHGFFQGDGWSESVDEILRENPERKITLEDLRAEDYSYAPKPLEFMPWMETVKVLFGEGPKRTEYPEIDLGDIPESDEATEEDLERLEARLEEYQNAVKVLEVLSEQCGCPKGDE